jgi:hypothetical protein
MPGDVGRDDRGAVGQQRVGGDMLAAAQVALTR